MEGRSLVAGFLLGAACGLAWGYTPGAPAEPSVVSSVASPLRQAARAPAPAAARGLGSELEIAQATLAEREAELELARATIAELERELYGVPLAWDDSIPTTHQPDFVTRNIERAMQECGVTARLVGFDCDEPPCFALLDTTPDPDDPGSNGHGALVDCPAWKEPWGVSVSHASDQVTCPDGSTRRFSLISPGTERVDVDWETFLTRERTDEDRADAENRMKRMLARAANAGPRVCR